MSTEERRQFARIVRGLLRQERQDLAAVERALVWTAPIRRRQDFNDVFSRNLAPSSRATDRSFSMGTTDEHNRIPPVHAPVILSVARFNERAGVCLQDRSSTALTPTGWPNSSSVSPGHKSPGSGGES